MIVNNPFKRDFSDVDIIGIAITYFGESLNQGHLALIFNDEGECKIFELTGPFERCLICRPINTHSARERFSWLDLDSGFSDVDKQVLLGLVLQILEANQPDDLAYGFDTNGTLFSSMTGEFKRIHPGQGLTCATLIAEVFDAAALPLIDRATWPRPDKATIKWQRKMVSMMKTNNLRPELVHYQTTLVGSKRFFPEQVAAATQIQPRPVKCGQVKPTALKLRKAAKQLCK